MRPYFCWMRIPILTNVQVLLLKYLETGRASQLSEMVTNQIRAQREERVFQQFSSIIFVVEYSSKSGLGNRYGECIYVNVDFKTISPPILFSEIKYILFDHE